MVSFLSRCVRSKSLVYYGLRIMRSWTSLIMNKPTTHYFKLKLRRPVRKEKVWKYWIPNRSGLSILYARIPILIEFGRLYVGLLVYIVYSFILFIVFMDIQILIKILFGLLLLLNSFFLCKLFSIFLLNSLVKKELRRLILLRSLHQTISLVTSFGIWQLLYHLAWSHTK